MREKGVPVRIVIPVTDERLAMHFGHCDQFTLFDVDPENAEILKRESVSAPPHQRGVLPDWLSEQGAEVIIVGGMGGRAQELFREKGIKVIAGSSELSLDELVKQYLEGVLAEGPEVCDHSEKPCHDD
jgi:ATP-binding protein involved in chromosome partitioning